MMKFFFAPATCALASRIALEEAGAPYEPVRIDFKTGGQRAPDYLKINPKGRVPALATEQGVLTETPAILLYVAQSYPAAKLAPLDDPFALARVQAFNSYLCSTVHVAHAHRVRGSRWVDADDQASIAAMKKKVPLSVGDCFDLIEREMLAGPWVMGERYTIGDPYLFTLAQWLDGDGVDRARFPKLAEHTRRIKERPAVQRALAGEV
jgi:glutathione S-transferase